MPRKMKINSCHDCFGIKRFFLFLLLSPQGGRNAALKDCF